jgi:hypothetical protein
VTQIERMLFGDGNASSVLSLSDFVIQRRWPTTLGRMEEVYGEGGIMA